MFQRKLDELFSDVSNDDILIAVFDADGRNHDVSLQQVLQRCRQANLKVKTREVLFR